jgi:DNA mismatch repair ATPase MutS
MVSVSYHKIISFIHKKLRALSTFLIKVKAIWDKVGLFGCNEFHGILNNIEIPSDYESFWNPIFMDDHKWYTDKGTVLTLYWKIKDGCHIAMRPMIKYIGMLDAWTSIASLELGIPRFIWNSEKPSINIEKFWNPLITISNTKTIPIQNDILCGGKEPQNIIITSPNASGKSTCMKAIIECLLLAQTICRVPAVGCTITPFKYIDTYLNIPDTQGKESLFQAEMARCYKQIENLKGLNEREYAFTIMDEIFTSTNHVEGISGTYGVMRKMASFNNSICMVTTHFDVIKKAFKKDARFKNYHLPIEIKDDKIIKTYKLVAGFSKTPKIALELLKCKGFDSDILNDAKKMYDILTRGKKKSAGNNDNKNKKSGAADPSS